MMVEHILQLCLVMIFEAYLFSFYVLMFCYVRNSLTGNCTSHCTGYCDRLAEN